MFLAVLFRVRLLTVLSASEVIISAFCGGYFYQCFPWVRLLTVLSMGEVINSALDMSFNSAFRC